MNAPKTPQQLADAIETIVASYVDEVRRTVQHAVERSLSGTASNARAAKTNVARYCQPSSARPRRSATALDELCDKLHQCVCDRPGESMLVLADEIGCGVRELQRPMSKLKTQGRVRSVGQRNLMRYFPAVARASKSSG
jgi:hypothetical protein